MKLGFRRSKMYMSDAAYDAIVIGGGLAGCSAAIQLAQKGHRVGLFEKLRYPAHKLCGEFLSPEAQGSLEKLGVLQAAFQAGANPVRRFRITTRGGLFYDGRLPGMALGLSRAVLDDLLVVRAGSVGVDVHMGEAAVRLSGDFASGFVVATRDAAFTARIVVGAYGKRDKLDRMLHRPFLEKNEPRVAFKGHFGGGSLDDEVELHAFNGGYCGLVRIEGGLINACWIAHRDVLKQAGGRPEAMIERTLTNNPLLAERLHSLSFAWDSFVSVSQISFQRKEVFSGDVCMVGDTAGMIAPACGDGMAMALRSAELAAPLLDAFLHGRLAVDALKSSYQRAWAHEFRLRLLLGKVIQWGYVRPPIARAAVELFHVFPVAASWMVKHSRG